MVWRGQAYEVVWGGGFVLLRVLVLYRCPDMGEVVSEEEGGRGGQCVCEGEVDSVCVCVQGGERGSGEEFQVLG